METINHFIGGREVEGTSGRHGDVYNPAVGELVRRVAFADEGELDAAVSSATQAFPAWAATPPLRRARVLFRLKGLIEQHMDEMAAVVTEEHGKTVDGCDCIHCHAIRQKAKRQVKRANAGRQTGDHPNAVDFDEFWDHVHEWSRMSDLDRIERL